VQGQQRQVVATLAKQINLSPADTVYEINDFCAKLLAGVHDVDEEEDLVSAPTPKATHGPGVL
jgi:hypothetical protein